MEEIILMSRRVEKFNARLERSRWNIQRFRDAKTPLFIALSLQDFRDELHLQQSFVDSLLLQIDKVKAREEIVFAGDRDEKFEALDLMSKATRELRNALGIEEKQVKSELLATSRSAELIN